MLRLASLSPVVRDHILSGLNSRSRISVEQQKGGGQDTRGTLRGASSPIPPSSPPTAPSPNPQNN